MAMHILSAINVAFQDDGYRDITRGQRSPLIAGMYVLSDLIVGDHYRDTIHLCDIIYKRAACWDKLYIPTIVENQLVYKHCAELYVRGPAPWFKESEAIEMLDSMDNSILSSYTRACVAASIALRVLIGRSTTDIDKLCEHILLFIKQLIAAESNIVSTYPARRPLGLSGTSTKWKYKGVYHGREQVAEGSEERTEGKD